MSDWARAPGRRRGHTGNRTPEAWPRQEPRFRDCCRLSFSCRSLSSLFSAASAALLVAAGFALFLGHLDLLQVLLVNRRLLLPALRIGAGLYRRDEPRLLRLPHFLRRLRAGLEAETHRLVLRLHGRPERLIVHPGALRAGNKDSRCDDNHDSETAALDSHDGQSPPGLLPLVDGGVERREPHRLALETGVPVRANRKCHASRPVHRKWQ